MESEPHFYRIGIFALSRKSINNPRLKLPQHPGNKKINTPILTKLTINAHVSLNRILALVPDASKKGF